MPETTMKAAVLHKNGDPTTEEVLSVETNVDIPEPKEVEILVKVSSASINPIDYKLMNGEFPGKKNGPVGFDVSGVVHKIGPGCNGTAYPTLKVGDEVYANAAATQGTFAEYVRVQAIAVSPKPKNVTLREAASLPLAGLTALQGLVTQGLLKKGQRVAILGGAGGVGSLAVQMAKALGAEHVFATGSSVEFIRGLGADTVINYRETSVEQELQGKELDLVFDTVGGIEGWKAAQAGLKRGGKFVSIVGDGGSLAKMIPGVAWRKFSSLIGGPSYTVFVTDTKAPAIAADMTKLTELIESGKVKPLVDERSFELNTESVAELVKACMSHRTKGKLVLTVSK